MDRTIGGPQPGLGEPAEVLPASGDHGGPGVGVIEVADVAREAGDVVRVGVARPGPPTSGIGARLLATTGAPQAWASITGHPKPSA